MAVEGGLGEWRFPSTGSAAGAEFLGGGGIGGGIPVLPTEGLGGGIGGLIAGDAVCLRPGDDPGGDPDFLGGNEGPEGDPVADIGDIADMVADEGVSVAVVELEGVMTIVEALSGLAVFPRPPSLLIVREYLFFGGVLPTFSLGAPLFLLFLVIVENILEPMADLFLGRGVCGLVLLLPS